MWRWEGKGGCGIFFPGEGDFRVMTEPFPSCLTLQRGSSKAKRNEAMGLGHDSLFPSVGVF